MEDILSYLLYCSIIIPLIPLCFYPVQGYIKSRMPVLIVKIILALSAAAVLLALGGKGVISVLSNVAPQETHDICAKFFAGDVAGSTELQLRAIPLIEQLFCEVNPIPVKKAMALMGMDCGPLRMPLTELSAQHVEALRKAMKDFGIALA